MSCAMIRNLFAALIACVAMSPLQAQLDNRLFMPTDAMDVYKNPITVKPEIITLIDMSGSTAAVTWHSSYSPPASYGYNTDNQTHVPTSSDSGSQTKELGAGLSIKVEGTTYSNVKLSLIVPVVGCGVGAEGSFIMPDGTTIEEWLAQSGQQSQYFDSIAGTLKFDASGDTSPIRSFQQIITGYDRRGRPIYGPFVPSNNSTWPLLPNHRYFAMKATHGRMKYNNKIIDIPIPWKIFDSPSTATPANVSTSSGVDPISSTTIQFDTRDGRPAVTGGAFKDDVVMYNDNYLGWIFTGGVVPATDGATAWANGIPGLTRLQAMKRAVLQTWMAVQTKVLWAVTALDAENDNNTNSIPANPTESPYGAKRQVVRLLANSSSPAISWLQQQTSDNGTPLAYALARTYAEMVDGRVFASARSNETILNPCRKHFVILFTDGLDSGTPGTGDPFKNSTVTKATDASGVTTSTYSGVTTLKNDPSRMNAPNIYFNMWSMAGAAANGIDQAWTATKPTASSTTGSISEFAPFSVTSRDGGTAFKPAHSIETMTIGVSLFGDAAIAGSSRNALLLTAGYGQAGQERFDSANYVPSTAASTNGKTQVRFWDAKNASDLGQSIEEAILGTMDAPPTTTSPVSPMSGLRAGDQVYFAKYKAGKYKVPLWSGDLFMVQTQTSGTDVKFKGADGLDLSGVEISAGNAIWAASKILGKGGLLWSNRKVYTYLGTPSGTGDGTNRFANLNQKLTDASCSFITSNAALVTYMTGKSTPPPSSQELTDQKAHIEWMLGKDREDGGQILGDVINSTPVVVEYGLGTENGNLAAAGLSGAVGTGKSGTRLRLIFVGTNHGMLHAFAEASYLEGGVLRASATELWAFVPPEFVKGAYEQLNGHSAHVYMVDGPVAGYLDESEAKAGYVGKVDNIKDKAMVVFGLGKGGRSFYALDVSDPFVPKLAWALRPDVETGSGANVVIGNMGMSTGIPDQGRIKITTTLGSVTTHEQKDLLFIGGGLSTDGVDAAFGSSRKLGRSVLAIETQTGVPYQTWDFRTAPLSNDFPNMGSVAAGPMAMEVLVGSGLTQRVYFSDRSGGVYALGSGKRQPAVDKNPGIRIESNDPKAWVKDDGTQSVRTLFRSSTGECITTSPVPFHLPHGYPGTPIAGKNPPQAVGVAFGTGDLWDPMDRDAVNPTQVNANEYNRLVVVFDRNDSDAMSYGSNGVTLTDLTTPGTKVVPTSSDYYLKSSDGYFLGFDRAAKPAGQPATETANGVSLNYYKKIISEPLVFRGVLYFPVFKPDVSLADGTCSGVSKTTVYRVADVMNPKWLSTTVPDAVTGGKFDSGALFTFAGIPGKLVVLSPTMVGLAGTMIIDRGGNTLNQGKGVITVGTDSPPLLGPPVRMRSWRIIR